MHSPYKYHNYIQNFTFKGTPGEIPKGETHSFLYRFRPDPYLLPITYQLVLDTTYRVDDEPHLTAFYNRTISMFEKPFEFDARWIIQVSFSLISLPGISSISAGLDRGCGSDPGCDRPHFLIERIWKEIPSQYRCLFLGLDRCRVGICEKVQGQEIRIIPESPEPISKYKPVF
jgi:hypothetical protein